MSEGKTEIETFFGRCRCCLSYGYLKNMWIEHRFEGDAEIYGEILVQCFALTWEHTEDSMEQDQICEQCICRLRDANDFKRVVMDSQEELIQQIDAENTLTIKEEHLDRDFLDDYKHAVSEDTADTMYADTEYTMDTADAHTEYTMDTADAASVKDEAEYEEVEYLEDEVIGGTNDAAIDTDNSQITDQSKPVKRRKQSRQLTADDDEDTPKRKWPRKLPKSERHKTYKQYSEDDLRKCLEEVRNNVLTAREASLKYEIPKKTICAKIKMDPNDVGSDSTNKTTRKNVTTSKTKGPTVPHEEAKETDSETENQEIPNKLLMLKHKHNLSMILKYSNATLIKNNSAAGYSCWFCDKQFDPEKLKQHNLNHEDVYDDAIKVQYVSDLIIKLDITRLECKLCEEIIDSLEKFMNHLQEDHDKTIYTDIDNHFIPFKFDTEELQCAICAAEFKYFKLLTEHMSEHYSNYKCPDCDRVFINKQSMQTHRYRHKKGEYKCSLCPKIFDSLVKMREHERVVHRLANKKRKCGFCEEKFTSAEAVKSHEAREHGVTRPVLFCADCNGPYSSQKSLKIHIKRDHMLLRPFVCEPCGRAFYTRQELNWHSATHSIAREFHCDQCDNSFRTKPALSQHLRAHKGFRKYKCEFCSQAFVHMSTWKRHVFMIHGEKAVSTRKRQKKSQPTQGVFELGIG